jgi:cellulose synthase/poly-beta-1,6-N-acetylglucosamine synthase-like glycosyltransferase
MFEILFLIFVSFYFVQAIIFIIGASKEYPKLDDGELPTISVIVAARNEEDNILDCMESLENLIYPEGKIEIILVNDGSTDSTEKLIEDFIKDKPKFKCIVPEKEIGQMKGKANAIANGVNVCKGEVILTTDADCVVSPAWAKTIASYYQKDIAIVCGFTNQSGKSLFAGMQSMDFIYLLTVAAGAMNLGKPLSCIGNNMSYSKKAYDETGGYEKIPFTVTEDFQVLMAIHNLQKYKILYPPDDGALVTSKPCKNLRELYRQKKRWGRGGLESDFTGFAVMAVGFLTHIAILLTPFFFTTVSLYLCLFKIFMDYFFLFPVHKKLKLEFSLKHFLAFEVYFIVYVVLLPFIVLFDKNVKWKGREFS